jgi:hypothetical protein
MAGFARARTIGPVRRIEEKLKKRLHSPHGLVISHAIMPFVVGMGFKPLAAAGSGWEFVTAVALLPLAALSLLIVLDLRAIRLWRYPSTTLRECLTALAVPCGMLLMVLLLFCLLAGTATAHQISPGVDERSTAWFYAAYISIFFGVPIGLIVGCVALVTIGLFPPRSER